MNIFTKWMLRAAAITICLLALHPSAIAQTQSKRLILKDGSYQLATKWEVKGDRVRYYSAERYTWEELPKSLVDWDATNKYQSDRAAGKAAGDAQAQAEAEAERKAEEAHSPTIAPGLKLPDSGGIFVLDTYQQQPQLAELVQNSGEINKHTGKNIMRAVINPLPTGPKQTVELKGLRARIQAHTPKPDIYINVNYDNDDADSTTTDSDAKTGEAKGSDTKSKSHTANNAKQPLPPLNLNDRFKIVRVEKKPKEQVRVVSNMKIGLTGHIKEQQNVVDTSTQSITADWIKITPTAPLEAGEYAVVEMLGPKQMNLYVWDFGVDPSAPPNPSVWKPAQAKKVESGTDESPVLGKRPKFNYRPEDFNSGIRVNPSGASPRGLYTPDPEYTDAARRAGIEGVVVLHVLVSAAGVPQDIKVMRSLDPGLDQEAIKALRQWKFPPAMKNGTPVPVETNVEVNFRLYRQPK